MKRISIILLLLLFISFGCAQDSDERKIDTSAESESHPSETEVEDTKQDTNTFNVTIGNISYTAELDESETAKAFSSLLPFTCEMTELNGNEKYYQLPETLPETDEYSGTIHAGDIMLYQDNTLVLFYEDFETSYSYTPIGRIIDPTGLKDQLGTGNVEVTFN